MLIHLVIEISSDGDLDLTNCLSEDDAVAFIYGRAHEIYEIMSEEFSKKDLHITIHPKYARLSIEAPGQEFDRILEYRTLIV